MATDYDAWLLQGLGDNEATYWFNCAEVNDLSEVTEENEDGLPFCDFDGAVDCYTKSSRGRGWWEVEYIGKCPKCERTLTRTESDCKENHE